MNKLSVILNDTPRFLARARNDMSVILRRKPKNLGVILVVFLVLTALFLYFTKGTKAVGWWTGGGGSWQARKQLTITNNSSSSLSANTTVAITIDTATLVSQGKLRSDCADLRVLYQPSSSTTTELTRSLSYASTATGVGTCSTSYATKVSFKLQASLSSTASSTDYYMYYKNLHATAPTSTDAAYNVGSINATLVCPFDGSTTCAAGETPSAESGAIRYTGSKSAMNFDGYNDNVNIGGSMGQFSAGQGYTLEAWVNPKLYPAGNLYGIMHFTDNLRLSLNGGTGVLVYRTSAGTITSTSAIPINTWTHVAAVYSGTTMYLFVNGTQVASSTVAVGAVTPGCGSIGSDYTSCIPGLPIRVFYGAIDEVRISTIARYTSNFTPQTAPFVTDSNTRLLMHFDENGDDARNTGKAFDDSGNGNHGTITGAKYVSGLVGLDNGTSDTGTKARQSNGAHEGIMIEEATNNLITDPSFENATYNTVWGTAGANLTAGLTSSAPNYKFGVQAFRGIGVSAAISGTSNMETISINPGSTNSHTLSFYAYDGTSTNTGGTVSSSIVKPVWEGVAQSSGTYTDMGGGWWRVYYTAATTNSANQYGFEIQPNRLVYIDGVQLETNPTSGVSYMSTYTDGSLGVGYSWSGTANNSVSGRGIEKLTYATSGNLSASSGSLGLWMKVPTGATHGGGGQSFIIDTDNDTLSCNFLNYSGVATYAAISCAIKQSNGTYRTASSTSSGTRDQWKHMLLTWSGSTITLYINGVSEGTNTSWDGTMLSSTAFTLGYYVAGTTTYCNCILSDFRLYDNALSSTQAMDLYKSGQVGHSESYQVDAFSDNKGQNPISTYHMDEAQGSTVYDSTLQANHLTLGTGSSAPTWTTSTTGNSNPRNTSLKFDGSNDYITRSYDADFDVGTDSFSVSGWFRHPSTISGQDTILSRYGSAGYKVYMNSSGYICFGIDDDSTWSPDDSACSTTSFADSAWHTFEAVKTSTTSITLYVDGKSVGSDSSLAATATLNPGNTTTGLYLGIDSDFASNPWDGYLDEFNFYPYARSAAQVKTDYAGNQKSGVLGANTNDPLSNGLVGYWKLDEGSGTTTADSSGNGYTGTLGVGASAPSWSGGKFGSDLQFDGTSDFVDLGDRDMITGNTMTASAWIKTTGTIDEYELVIGKNHGAFSWALQGDSTTNKLRFVTSSYTNKAVSNSTLNDGLWHNVVGVYDGTLPSANLKLYVDGVLQTTTGNATGAIPATTDDESIGAVVRPSSPGNAFYFPGNIDEARVYNRALSPGEVQQLYNYAPGPIHYWKFDDRSGPTALDIGSSAINGTLTSNPRWTSGKFGSALSYNNGPYVDAGDVSYADWTGFSVGSWVYWDGTTHGGYEGLYSKQTTNSDLGRLLIKNDGQILVQTANGSFTSNAAGDVPANTWAYISYIYDQSAGYEYLYVNGILKGSLARTGNVTQDANSLRIGWGHVNNTAYTFSGKIDDFKIYNYARTQKQIVEDMNAGLNLRAGSVGGASLGGAVGYWKFDEGQGTVANNAGIGNTGPSDLNGTLGTGSSAPSWSNAGKFGKALTFDGTSDFASVADNSVLDFGTGDFSVSTWLKTSSNADGRLVGKYNDASGAGWVLRVQNISRIVFSMSDGTNTATATNTQTGYYDGSWHHIVATVKRDSSTGIKVYFDGKLQSTTASPTSVTSIDNALAVQMGHGMNGGYKLTGSLDEVKIYNYALTSSEIKTDYNRGQSLVLGSMSDNSTYERNAANQEYCVPGDSTSCAGPVAEWKMDEGSGSSVSDTSANANTGTFGVGSSAPTWAPGKLGKSVKFDGIDDYMSYGLQSTYTNNYTIEGWVKLTTGGTFVGNRPALLTQTGCSSTKSVELMFWGNTTSSPQYIQLGRCAEFNGTDSTNTFNLNTWTHIAVTATSGNVVTYYINGVPAGSWTSAYDLSIKTDARIGNDAASGTRDFTGFADNVRIFNYVRTPAQVAWDYNRGGPVAHYKLDECSGGTANDASGNGNNGTLTIGASGTQTSNGTCGSGTSTEAWSNGASGKFNSSMNFDGTDDYISVGTTAGLQLTSIGTVSAWINPAAIGQFRTIIDKGVDWSANQNVYTMYLNSSNRATCLIGGSSSSASVTTTSNALSTSAWNHLSCTWDGTTIKIYVNGVMNNSASQGSVTPNTSNSTLYIGRAGVPGGSTDDFSGQIDDVRIYNYALTSTQVKNTYLGGNSVYYGPASGQP